MPRRSRHMTVRGRKVSDAERKAIWAKKTEKIKTKHQKRKCRTKRKKIKKIYGRKRYKIKRDPKPPRSTKKYDKYGRKLHSKSKT